MLSSLSGRSHQVVSGCVLIFHTPSAVSSYQIVSFHVVTEVTFCTLSREVITAYINTDEPFDKAGGYGMQAKAASFVEKLNGCYFNVVGLPVHMLSRKIAENIHFLNIETKS
jgi:septum formation protein